MEGWFVLQEAIQQSFERCKVCAYSYLLSCVVFEGFVAPLPDYSLQCDIIASVTSPLSSSPLPPPKKFSNFFLKLFRLMMSGGVLLQQPPWPAVLMCCVRAGRCRVDNTAVSLPVTTTPISYLFSKRKKVGNQQNVSFTRGI